MCSAVVEAVMMGSRDALSDALSMGGNPDDTQNSVSALKLACIQERDDLVSELLRYGARVNASDEEGVTALHTAASTGNSKIVSLLLDAGADPEAMTSTGQTPLMRAAQTGDEKVVRLLCQRKAAASRTDKGGLNALHWTAIGGDFVEAFAALVEGGAKINSATRDGRTPLDYAVSLKRPELVEFISSLPEKDDNSIH